MTKTKEQSAIEEKDKIIQQLKKAMILGKELYDNINWDDLEHYEAKSKDDRIKSLEEVLKELVELKDMKHRWESGAYPEMVLPKDFYKHYQDAWSAARKLISGANLDIQKEGEKEMLSILKECYNDCFECLDPITANRIKELIK